MTWQIWVVFVLASLPIHFAPGPNNVLALRNGGIAGLRAAAGAMLGRLPGYGLIFLAAGLGLAAMLSARPLLFALLKLCGGLYLCWIAVATLRVRPSDFAGGLLPQGRRRPLLRQEFLTAVSNPKAILFATAFYAQFLSLADPEYGMHFFHMVCVSLSLESIAGAGYAAAGARLAAPMKSAGRLVRLAQGCGLLLLIIGALLSAEGLRGLR